jgi:drug/metabolite transporter (DMT)-like permease
VLNPIWVLIFMGEKPTGWALVGGAVVVSAVTARALVSVQRRGRTPPPSG